MNTFFEGNNVPADYAIRMKRLIPKDRKSSLPKCHWFLVQTHRGNLFFYNKATGESAWEPTDVSLSAIIEQMNMQQVMKLLDFNHYIMEEESDSDCSPSKVRKGQKTSHANIQEQPVATGEQPVVKDELEDFETDFTEYQDVIEDCGHEAAENTLETLIEDAALPVPEPKPIPVSQLKAEFFDLLKECKVTSFSLYELEKLKFAQDPRFLVLSQDQAKKYFELFLKSNKK